MILYGWFIGSLGPWDRWHRPAEPVRDPVQDPWDPWDPWDPPWLRGWRPLGHPSRNLEINGNQGFDWKKPGEICDNLCLEHWQCTSTSSVSVQMMFYVFFIFFHVFSWSLHFCSVPHWHRLSSLRMKRLRSHRSTPRGLDSRPSQGTTRQSKSRKQLCSSRDDHWRPINRFQLISSYFNIFHSLLNDLPLYWS